MPIYTLKLLDRHTVANNTIALTLEKPAGFQYIAGQYAGYTLINPAETDEKGNTRRFSFLSAPDDEHIVIATRVQTSAFKRNLQNLAPGSQIKMAGPTGNFVLHTETDVPAVMIAGGIGLAPFYSMIRQALAHAPQPAITLFYGNQSLGDAAYFDELTNLAATHPSFKFIPVLANPHAGWTGATGFITQDILAKNIPDLDQPLYYVCGSPGMVSAMQGVLKDMMIADERVKVEDFPGY